MSVLRDDLTPNISLSPLAKVYQHLYIFSAGFPCAFKVQILNLKTTARFPLGIRPRALRRRQLPFLFPAQTMPPPAMGMPAAKMPSVPSSARPWPRVPSADRRLLRGKHRRRRPRHRTADGQTRGSLASPAFVVSNNVPSRTDVPPVNESRPASVEAGAPGFSAGRRRGPSQVARVGIQRLIYRHVVAVGVDLRAACRKGRRRSIRRGIVCCRQSPGACPHRSTGSPTPPVPSTTEGAESVPPSRTGVHRPLGRGPSRRKLKLPPEATVSVPAVEARRPAIRRPALRGMPRRVCSRRCWLSRRCRRSAAQFPRPNFSPP